MKRAEFCWRTVFVALGDADLSDAFDARGIRNPNPLPAWPSDRYREIFRELERRLISPPRDRQRSFGSTVADLEKCADLMIAELARAQAPDPVTADRFEMAAAALQKAKRLARQTRLKPSVFDS